MDASLEIYDGIANEYSEYASSSNFTKDFLLPVLWSSVGKVQGKTILDMACGTGETTTYQFVLKGAKGRVKFLKLFSHNFP